MQHILVVEDDEMIAAAVAARLRAEGYGVVVTADGEAAVAHATTHPVHLIVLDLMLPGLDGLEVCRRVQQHGPVPVLILTARADEVDVLVGLNVGADDYMTKPFSPRELVARIQAILRRVDRSAVAVGVRQIGDVHIDPARRRVSRAGTEVHLTPTEFDLIALLAAEPGIVRDRSTIVRQLWGFSDEASERTVDSHVRSVRRKLGEGLIRTVRGVGYACAEPDGAA